MTKELLEQYRWLALEIANEQARLEVLDRDGVPRGMLHDTLLEILGDRETSPELIRGIRESAAREREMLVAGLHRAEAQCAEIEKWITGISDQRIQRYLILRYVDGLGCNEIAAKTGETPDAVRKALDRFFQVQEARP